MQFLRVLQQLVLGLRLGINLFKPTQINFIDQLVLFVLTFLQEFLQLFPLFLFLLQLRDQQLCLVVIPVLLVEQI